MVTRLLAILLFLSTVSFAGITDDVREALARSNAAAASAELQAYRSQQGVTPDYLEALSWMARASLASHQPDQADTYAKQTERLSRQMLAKRPLDAEPHLPIALGAALEVQAQVLAARDVAGPVVGDLAPPLKIASYLGPKPVALSQLNGSPVLLFFWAHWCGDCKAEGPVIAQLSSEFGSRGLMLLAPTQLYGYGARGEDATPKDELPYVERVWQHFYPALRGVPVPVSKENFNLYGASTTPTLVLLDRAGRVALYHPGVVPYEDLRAAIEKVVR